MENRNICLFVPRAAREALHIFHFVLETTAQSAENVRMHAFYRMHIVLNGRGTLRAGGRVLPLSAGDVFFTFPGTPYALQSEEDFRYAYISYLGARANAVTDSLRIGPQRCLFDGFSDLTALWTDALHMNACVEGLNSEAVLLYTFAAIGNRYPPDPPQRNINPAAVRIKAYLDENASDASLCLNALGRVFSYTPKYLSALFKKAFGIGIAEYLNLIRIQNACTLMEQGIANVQTVAYLCGYDDALYFSKVFKARMGLSPKEHIRRLATRGNDGQAAVPVVCQT